MYIMSLMKKPTSFQNIYITTIEFFFLNSFNKIYTLSLKHFSA